MSRVLVVEDSPSTRSFVRNALESAPDFGVLEVIEAASGVEALHLLPRGPYRLVITDINMPDINGFELVQIIRRNPHHRETPVLLVSTQSSERMKERGLSAGANGYLAKPFTPQELCEATREFLR